MEVGSQSCPAAFGSGLPDADGVCKSVGRDRPWKRRSVEKSKSRLFHRAWKSRRRRGIPTFPPPRRLRMCSYNDHVRKPKPGESLIIPGLKMGGRSKQMMLAGEYRPLIEYEKLGREALLAIPTPDHYLPLLYVIATKQQGEVI